MDFFAKAFGFAARVEICSCTYEKKLCKYAGIPCSVHAGGRPSLVQVDCTTGEECTTPAPQFGCCI